MGNVASLLSSTPDPAGLVSAVNPAVSQVAGDLSNLNVGDLGICLPRGEICTPILDDITDEILPCCDGTTCVTSSGLLGSLDILGLTVELTGICASGSNDPVLSALSIPSTFHPTTTVSTSHHVFTRTTLSTMYTPDVAEFPDVPTSAMTTTATTS